MLEVREKTFLYLKNSADRCAIQHMRFTCRQSVANANIYHI